MAVPYTFQTATGSIPLSQLDSNFSTAITIGNTAVVLGDTISTINNLSLANVSISSVSTAFPNGYLANSNVIVGTTTLTLGSTVTTIDGLTLSNVTIASGNVTISNVTVSNFSATTANVSGTANISNLVVIGNATVGGNVTAAKGTFTSSNISGTENVATLIVIGNGTVGGNVSVTGNVSMNVATITTANVSGTANISTLVVTGSGSFTSTGAVLISKGTTAQQPAGVAGYLRFNTDTTQFEGYNGTTWSGIGAGAGLSNDTTTATNVYPLFASSTTGTPTTIYTSNAKYLYKPSTGELQASIVNASNGIVVNSKTVSTSYTIATGYSAMSAGPITVASGQTVTVSSGSRWVVL